MTQFLIGLWNANGLAKHNQDIQHFLSTHKIDIMLVSETHFTDRSYFKVPNYQCYYTLHPDNTAHGGSAVLIRKQIKHYELPKYEEDYLQATTVVVEDWAGPLTISAVYCPPRHNISHQQFSMFFNTLGPRFLSGGDYNAKHQLWGSRLANPRGRNLLTCMNGGNLNHFSTGEPTYWPTDIQKTPDLLDFFVTKGISHNYLNIASSLDLSSDHSPVILTASSTVLKRESPPILCNKRTDWARFRYIFNDLITLKVPLKTAEDINNAVETFNSAVQTSAWRSTPRVTTNTDTHVNYPVYIKQKIAEKRRLRRVWQNSRNQVDKTNLNRATQQLKRMLKEVKNEWFQEFTSNLSPTEASNYSLWKVTKTIKQPQTPIPPIRKTDGSWAKSSFDKAETFASYFANVFKPNPAENNYDNSEEIQEYLDAPNQLSLPISPFKPSEVKLIINSLRGNKAPGYDLITGQVLKELPRKGIVFLTLIFNAILRLEYFPLQWRLAQIVVVLKPGKPPNQTSSYRPISLLPVTSKVFEKLFLKRLLPIIRERDLIPDHQFGFRQEHSTIQQVHRIVDVIRQALESKQYCSAAFLDVRQAFDKVWHLGLLYKLKCLLPHPYYSVLKSYLCNRYFQIKYQDVTTSLHGIQSGVPQGSVLGPLLYILFTYDIPIYPGITLATFADDTALLSTHDNPVQASQELQIGLNYLAIWLKLWRIKVNEGKSTHITFTLNFQTCPTVILNNINLPEQTEVKYLGMHLDRKLTWRSHIWNKRLNLNMKYYKMAWLLGEKSHLSAENKLLLYKVVLKPVWTYGIQLWGTASNSNIEIIQRFQSKTLRKILQAPWYVRNSVIHKDSNIPLVQEEVTRFSKSYLNKLENHSNYLAVNLLDNSNSVYRLQRANVLELPFRFPDNI